MTPNHYHNEKNYDVIDFVKDYDLNFNEGNVIKYVARELTHVRKEQAKWIELNK
jgi:hypothetical protein